MRIENSRQRNELQQQEKGAKKEVMKIKKEGKKIAACDERARLGCSLQVHLDAGGTNVHDGGGDHQGSFDAIYNDG